MFHPNLGRWMTLDPIEYGGDDINLYRGIANSPTNHLDPMGLSANSKINISIIPPFEGSGVFRSGIEISYGDGPNATTKYISFVAYFARVTCYNSRSCEPIYDKYWDVIHGHEGDTPRYSSHPSRPKWYIDVPPKTGTPEYFPKRREFFDNPHSVDTLRQEYQREVDSLQKSLQVNSSGGVVQCHIKVTATFVTYVIVDGRVVGSVEWSVDSDTGQPQNPRIINDNRIRPKHAQIIQDTFPGYTMPRYDK